MAPQVILGEEEAPLIILVASIAFNRFWCFRFSFVYLLNQSIVLILNFEKLKLQICLDQSPDHIFALIFSLYFGLDLFLV